MFVLSSENNNITISNEELFHIKIDELHIGIHYKNDLTMSMNENVYIIFPLITHDMKLIGLVDSHNNYNVSLCQSIRQLKKKNK